MPVKLKEHATDQASFAVECGFKDLDNSTPVTPKTLHWTLLSPLRAVVNNRDGEEITELASTVIIPLTPADLNVADGNHRYLSLTWTYDSATYGNDLTGREQVLIQIDDIKEKAV